MGNIVPLSDGKSAELRDPKELSERQRRPLGKLMALVSPEGQDALEASRLLGEDGKPETKKKLTAAERKELQAKVRFAAADIDVLNELNDQAIVAFVKHWTREEAVTIDNVLELPTPDYDALRAAVAPLTAEVFVNFKASKDSSSPTAASNGSATASEASAPTISRKSGELISSSSSV